MNKLTIEEIETVILKTIEQVKPPHSFGAKIMLRGKLLTIAKQHIKQSEFLNHLQNKRYSVLHGKLFKMSTYNNQAVIAREPIPYTEEDFNQIQEELTAIDNDKWMEWTIIQGFKNGECDGK